MTFQSFSVKVMGTTGRTLVQQKTRVPVVTL